MPPKPNDAETDEHHHSQSCSLYSQRRKNKEEKRGTLEEGPMPAERPAIANTENITSWTWEAETCGLHKQVLSRIDWLQDWKVFGNPGAQPTLVVLFAHWTASCFLIQLAGRKDKV